MAVRNSRQSDCIVFVAEYVRSMRRRSHKPVMSLLDCRRDSHVFACGVKTQPGCGNALAEFRLSGKLVRELTALRHELPVSMRRGSQMRVPLQFRKTGFHQLTFPPSK